MASRFLSKMAWVVVGLIGVSLLLPVLTPDISAKADDEKSRDPVIVLDQGAGYPDFNKDNFVNSSDILEFIKYWHRDVVLDRDGQIVPVPTIDPAGPTPTPTPVVEAIAASHIHGDTATFEQQDCLRCHGNRYDERAPYDSSVLTAHSKMIQFAVPGGADMVTADTCRQCHKRVDLFEESGGAIRKQVSVTDPTLSSLSCHTCHMAGDDDFYLP